MALIEAALYQLLKMDAGIAAIVAERIHPVKLPQFDKHQATYPALVFELNARAREHTHDGPTGVAESRFFIHAMSPHYFQAKELADAVRLALDGNRAGLQALHDRPVGAVVLENESDNYEEDQVESLSLYHVPMEFLIEHSEVVNG